MSSVVILVLLQHSRRDARVEAGELVTLERQDRSLWDRSAIQEGLSLVEKALRLGPVGPYQLQAAIAALHAQASTPARTDWRQIAALYEKLAQLHPSPVVSLNHAVAVAMSGRIEDGLSRIEELGRGETLSRYYLFHAARADLLRRLDRCDEAADAYRRAMDLADNRIEAAFLERRLRQVMESGGGTP